MSGNGPVSLVAFAGCSSLGYSIPSTLAAMAAGLSNFTETGLRTLFDTPVTAGSLLDRDTPRLERLTTLVDIGLADLQTVLSELGIEHAPLMAGLPSDLEPDEQDLLREALRGHPAVDLEPALFPYGRASTFLALEHATRLVARGAHRAIVVGGIDSLCALPSVQWLLDTERVLGPHIEGTIPGEAAAFVLVARSDDPLARSASSIVLESIASLKSDIPFTKMDHPSADALATIFRTFRERGARGVDHVIAAHSGEGVCARIFANAYLRETDLMPEPLDVAQIADCVGDVGAAAGILGLAYAMYRMATERAGPTARALVYSESDTGELGGAIVEGAPVSWMSALPLEAESRN
jgi:3-oxoacyl-[acyl-carrier-protein] synthase-1